MERMHQAPMLTNCMLCLSAAIMGVGSAEELAAQTGYPILSVPISSQIGSLCTSESKLLVALLEYFENLKKHATSLDETESALLTAWEECGTPVILRIHCGHRAAEPFIVGTQARKSRKQEDPLQFRLPAQEMTPKLTALLNSWSEEKKAAYRRRLTVADLKVNKKFGNRHRTNHGEEASPTGEVCLQTERSSEKEQWLIDCAIANSLTIAVFIALYRTMNGNSNMNLIRHLHPLLHHLIPV